LSDPLVSVLIAVYNGREGIGPTLESLNRQTFRDFEVILVDDGSRDGSADLAESLGYRWLRVIRLERNIGQTAALNAGMRTAHGEYIARHDVEDISHPARFEEQVAFLKTHPRAGMVGCAVEWLDDQGNLIRRFDYPTEDRAIRERLKEKNSFGHGAVMFRREAGEALAFYRPDFRLAQDYDLWLRLSEGWETANLPDVLYSMRFSPTMASVRRNAEQNAYAALARQLAAERAEFGEEKTDPGPAAEAIHKAYRSGGKVSIRKAQAQNYAEWARRLNHWGGSARRYIPRLWWAGFRAWPFSLALWRAAARLTLRRGR
jgi:glycosyltransferase involved in cell wall biosynthesis